MHLKTKLAELIAQKDNVFSESLQNASFLEWLEDLNYCLGEIPYPHEIVFKIMDTIHDLILSHPQLSKEKITQLRARLQVFEKYEIQKLNVV